MGLKKQKKTDWERKAAEVKQAIADTVEHTFCGFAITIQNLVERLYFTH